MFAFECKRVWHAFEVTLRKWLWEQLPRVGLKNHEPSILSPARPAAGPQGSSVRRGPKRTMLARTFPHSPSQLFPSVAQGRLSAAPPSSMELGWFNFMWSPVSDIVHIYIYATHRYVTSSTVQLQKQVKEGLKGYNIL